MSLIGTPLLVLGILVAVALPVAVVVTWKRIRFVAVRVVAVVLCQLTALFAAGLALNDYGYFYGSWGELLGQQAPLGSASASFAVKQPLGHRVTSQLSVEGMAVHSVSPVWGRTGRVMHVQITGATTGLSEQAVVYLPPEYFQAKYAHTTFPAVEEFTGYPAAKNLLGRLSHYAGFLRRDIRSGRSKPMILVAANSSPLFPRDTECTDVPGGPQVLTFFAQDVTSAMQDNFRVRTGDWGTLGDSTGGYCATKVAMDYPTTFPAAVSLSGYYHAVQDSTTGDLYAGSSVVRDLNDLDWRLQHMPPPPISVLATIGADEFGSEGVAATDQFASLAHAPMRVYKWVVKGGAHNFSTWRREMPACFHFLSAALNPVRDPHHHRM